MQFSKRLLIYCSMRGAREHEGVGSDGTITEGSDDDENEVPSGVFPVMEI